jgi:hypothetical protein
VENFQRKFCHKEIKIQPVGDEYSATHKAPSDIMRVKHKLALIFYTECCILRQRVEIAKAIFKPQSF